MVESRSLNGLLKALFTCEIYLIMIYQLLHGIEFALPNAELKIDKLK